MLVREFDFELPPELIAQEPPAERSGARLLHMNRASGAVTHSTISALPTLFHEGDLVVVNNTRVFPARLLGRRQPSGGAVECLLLTRLGSSAEGEPGERWEALMHPGQKLKPGATVVFERQDPSHGGHVGGRPSLRGEVLERRFFGRRTIRLWTDDGSPVSEAIDRLGHIPLPPYIRRPDGPADRDRYQTVFAHERGSVAAPTAGLHFSDSLVAAMTRRGVTIAAVTLHVGYGTFQPIRVERVEDHVLEGERFDISEATAHAVNRALADGRRVVAVGTTTTRTLESAARRHNGRLVAERGTTDLFISPGFEFLVVSGLLTNFHLPQSSLLMLVSAFGGRERVVDSYRQAVAERSRCYSYGDAMPLG